MSQDIPGWVRTACIHWGRQKRRLWTGRDAHGNVDGYTQSLLGRIRTEREGTWQGQRAQHYPEVFYGDGFAVQRAIVGMAERLFSTLHFQYVWDPQWGVTAAQKAAFLGIKRTEYFALVEKAEAFVHGRLEAGTRPDAHIAAEIGQIIHRILKPAPPTGIRAQTAHQSQLNLRALERPLLAAKR